MQNNALYKAILGSRTYLLPKRDRVLRTIYTFRCSKSTRPKIGDVTNRCKHFASWIDVRNTLDFLTRDGLIEATCIGKSVRFHLTELGIQRLTEITKLQQQDGQTQ